MERRSLVNLDLPPLEEAVSTQARVSKALRLGRLPRATGDFLGRKLATALALLGTATKQSLKLPPPFDDLNLSEQLDALEWLAGFRGRMEGTNLSTTSSNTYLGRDLAENWERTVDQLVTLVLRQTAGEPQDIVRDFSGTSTASETSSLRTGWSLPLLNVRPPLLQTTFRCRPGIIRGCHSTCVPFLVTL